MLIQCLDALNAMSLHYTMPCKLVMESDQGHASICMHMEDIMPRSLEPTVRYVCACANAMTSKLWRLTMLLPCSMRRRSPTSRNPRGTASSGGCVSGRKHRHSCDITRHFHFHFHRLDSCQTHAALKGRQPSHNSTSGTAHRGDQMDESITIFT